MTLAGSDAVGDAGSGQLATPHTTGGSSARIDFSVPRGQLLVRLLKNKVFGILTFGIYRFWAKTHVRRMLWGGANIEGDRLEYLGTAKELFLGFLIAMMILTPLMLVAGLIVELLAVMSEAFLVLGQFLNIVFLYMFWQFARYRLWRYRLSRTSWRGIRFFLTGSAFKYALNVGLWAATSVLTLGWTYPVLQAYRLKYRLNNTKFGDGEFSYFGTVRGIYNIYWPAILITQAVVIGTLVGLYLFDVPLFVEDASLSLEGGKLPFTEQAIWTLALAGFAVFFTITILTFVVRVWEFRYLADMTEFNGARFISDLRVKSVFSILVLAFFFALISYLGLIALVFVAIMIDTAFAVFVMVGAFIIGTIAVEILMTLFLTVPMIAAVCHSLQIHNFGAFEHTAASSERSAKYAEGFADAMDVGAF